MAIAAELCKLPLAIMDKGRRAAVEQLRVLCATMNKNPMPEHGSIKDMLIGWLASVESVDERTTKFGKFLAQEDVPKRLLDKTDYTTFVRNCSSLDVKLKDNTIAEYFAKKQEKNDKARKVSGNAGLYRKYSGGMKDKANLVCSYCKQKGMPGIGHTYSYF